jgi:outer membrane lipoprotein-sorting protein
MLKKSILFLALFLIAATACAVDLTIDEIINKVQANQGKIRDMYAETTTTMTSNIAMPGQEGKGPKTMEQKARLWTKGEKLSKIETLTPIHQITVTNGTQMAIINVDTGQKVVQDLAKLNKEAGGMMSGQSGGRVSLDKVREYFTLTMFEDNGAYVVRGVPKKANPLMGRMEFYIDRDKWVPVKVMLYDTKGKQISRSDIKYQQINSIWVPETNKSDMTTPMGTMKIEMSYDNVKINSGLKDELFTI